MLGKIYVGSGSVWPILIGITEHYIVQHDSPKLQPDLANLWTSGDPLQCLKCLGVLHCKYCNGYSSICNIIAIFVHKRVFCTFKFYWHPVSDKPSYCQAQVLLPTCMINGSIVSMT